MRVVKINNPFDYAIMKVDRKSTRLHSSHT